MKKILILFLFLAFKAYATDSRVEKYEAEPQAVFNPPQIKTHVYENGVKLFFLEDRELPVFEVEALLNLGDIHDPSGKEGLTTLMVSAMRTGGTRSLSPDEIDNRLETMATKMNVDASKEFSTFHLQTMSSNLDASLQLFFDILKSPRFDPSRFDFSKQRIMEGIRRQDEDPEDMAGRKFREFVYGEKSPWALTPTLESVASITRQEATDWHHHYFDASRLSIAVSGDGSFEEIRDKLKPFVLSLPSPKVPLPSIKALVKEWKGGFRFISRPSNQSTVLAGHWGEKRFNPDKYAIILANHVLGGQTFGSRLGNRIRTELGLAYSVFSQFGFDSDYGIFCMGAMTKTESTNKVVEEMRQNLQALKEAVKPVTEKELEFSKKSILNQLIFQYRDPFDIVEAEMKYDFYGYPPQYLQIYQREIQKVTLGDVEKAFKEYFFPDKLQILVVGDPSLQKSPLKP